MSTTIKKILYYPFWVLDIIVALSFLLLNTIIIKLYWNLCCLKKYESINQLESEINNKLNNKSNNKQTDNFQRPKNKTLFLGSGKPMKYPGFTNEEYKKQWHRFFQKQLLHPTYDETYIFYAQAEKKEIYKLTKNVVAIAIPKPWKNSFFRKTVATFNLSYLLLFCLNLIKNRKINVIETFVPCDQLFFASLLGFISKKKIVAQVMGDYDLSSYSEDSVQDTLKKYFVRQLDKFILSIFLGLSSLVLACNKHCATFALCNGAHPAKIRLQRYTPTLNRIEDYKILPKQDISDFPKTSKNIILWSRFSPEKKLKYGIEGAFQVLENCPDVGLILVGYGPMYDDISNQIRSSKVSDRILLKSFMPFHELISYIHHSDLALIPLGGYALVEAALLKKPIVAFDLEWHHELLTDGYSGFLANYAESQDIYQKIREALENPEKARECAENAYKRSKIIFDLEKNENKEKIIMHKFREIHCHD